MQKDEKKEEALKYIEYIKGIVNVRYGDSTKYKESKYLGLKDNIFAIDMASRPLDDHFYPCIVLLTKTDDIIILFTTDLPTVDSDSLSEIRSSLKELVRKI